MRFALVALLLAFFTGCNSDQQQSVPLTNSSGGTVGATQNESGSGEGEGDQTLPNTDESNTSIGDNSSSEVAALFDSAANQVQQLTRQHDLEAPVTPSQWGTPDGYTLPVYTYPTDLPFSQQGELLHSAMRVVGLSPRTVYRFSAVTQPQTQESSGLFVFNTGANGQIDSTVCMDSIDCSGTATTGTVLIVRVAATAGGSLHSFNIEPTGERPVFDEGTSSNPVLLEGSLPTTHVGAVGPMRVAGQTLIAGESHYQVNGLAPGNRYRIAMLNRANMDALIEFSAPVDLRCDPNFSTEFDCDFVAGSRQIQFSVHGTRAIFGDTFELEISLLADTDQFDGSWHTPLVLRASATNTMQYYSKVDHAAGSYYRIDNLSPGIDYRVYATGKTDGASLSLFDGITGGAIYSPQCTSLIDSYRSSTDEVCIVTNDESVYVWVKGTALDTTLSEHGPAGGSRLLLSIVPGAGDEGTLSNPIEHVVNAATVNRFEGSARAQSIYRLTGLELDTPVMISIAAASANADVHPVDATGSTLSCDNAGSHYCVLTPTQSSILVAVTADTSTSGEPLWFTVSPPPVNETLSIDVQNLPHVGQVGSFFSNYTISGLQSDQYYLAEASALSTGTRLSAWPASSNAINCMTENDGGPSTGCLVADSGGNINIRVDARSNAPGALFNIDVRSALPLPADHVSTDTPIDIADNNATGSLSRIVVQGYSDEPIDAITVTVLLDHGYSKDLLLTLIAPDGRRFTLADHLASSLNVHTQFSDLAARSSSNVEADRYRRAFRPHQPLHPLHDTSANGEWQLHVADDRYSNISTALGGKLIGWGLSFSEPADTGYP